MRAFVTGGSGFVGRRLVEMLLQRGADVVALARTDNSASRLRELGVEVVIGDLSDGTAIISGMQSCDSVFHVAGHLKMWDSYAAFHSGNVDGTRTVLAASAAAGVASFVQVGAAASIMGKPRAMRQVTEDQYPLSFPDWAPYIATKARAEQMVIAANSHSLKTVVLRPPLIWGAGNAMLAEVTELVRAGKFGYIDHGAYDFSASHVDNVCAMALLAAERAPGASAYFVSDGVDYNFYDFFTALLATHGLTEPVKTNYPFGVAWTMAPLVESAWKAFRRPGEPPLTRQMVRLIGKPFTLSIERARRELGYAPVITIDEGMKQIAAAFAGRRAAA